MISIRKNVTSFGRATAVTAALSILSLGGIASDASAQDKIKWKGKGREAQFYHCFEINVDEAST